jgi:hypothetical protein
MSTRFLQQDLWPLLTESVIAEGGMADVAVAYFGNGASSLLPLSSGSRLVVDASEETVKAGSTSPTELIKLHLKGVAIYSVPNLHAKLFLVGERLFVGSSNASLRSAETLVEAMIVTEDADAVRDARSFFGNLVLQPELGRASLERLLQLYEPPKLSAGRLPTISHQYPPVSDGNRTVQPLATSTKVVAADPVRPNVWLTRVGAGKHPQGSDGAVELGKAIALTKIKDPGIHKVSYLWDSTNMVPYREGDLLIRVLTHKEPCLVEYPVTVLNIRKWVGKDTSATFVFFETLNIDRSIPEHSALLKLGWSDRSNLEKGPIDPEAVEKFFALWK